MAKSNRLFRSTVSRPLIYTCKIIWFTWLILAILYLARYDSLKFVYWDQHGHRKINVDNINKNRL